MIQAAVEGCVDYKEARLTDPLWRFQLQLLLIGLERRNTRELLQLRMVHHELQQLSPYLEVQAVNQHSKAALDRYQTILQLVRPQMALGPQVDTSPGALWAQHFGDQKDPQVAAQIEATAEAILKQARPARRPASVSPPVRTIQLPRRRV